MSLAPIILFAYNRPWHTRQTVEALQKNELAAESDLFIFADGPKSDATEECIAKIAEVRKYIHTIEGFKSITIEESPENNGLANSVIAGVTKIINQFGKVIVVEDDIVTHPFFLRFMNDALDYYIKNKFIFAISATMERFDIPDTYKDDVFLTYRFGSWGWASWVDRWNKTDWNIQHYNFSKKNIKRLCQGGDDLWPMLQAQRNGNIDSWAIRFGYNMAIQNKICLRPVKSLVSNIGMDGSGIHCGNNAVPLLPVFDNPKYNLKFQPGLLINKTITQNIQSVFRRKNGKNKITNWTKNTLKKALLHFKILKTKK